MPGSTANIYPKTTQHSTTADNRPSQSPEYKESYPKSTTTIYNATPHSWKAIYIRLHYIKMWIQIESAVSFSALDAIFGCHHTEDQYNADNTGATIELG